MKTRGRALVASAVGAALLLAPTSALAIKPVKAPPCTVSPGVTVQSVKVKGVTTIHVTGTTGTDVIDCSNAKVSVVVHSVGGGGTGDTIYGGSKTDDLYAENSGVGQTDYVTGNGGNDTIHAGGGDAVALAMGDDFNPAAALAGDDTIVATGGFVQFYGGAGNDVLDVSAATGSLVEGNAGDDRVLGSPGHDALYGGAGDDILTDYTGTTEIFDCGDGAADILNDFDGNGLGVNGLGWRNESEDDSHVGCETVWVDDTAPCSFTPGSTGCIILANVAITDDPSTATYLLSGTVTFTPTCNPLVPPCDYSYPNILIGGNGTFSVSGTQTTSGTWTIPAQPNDRPNPSTYQFLDSSGSFTTCDVAVIRQVTFNMPLLSGNGDTGGGPIGVRIDYTGTTDAVGGTWSTGPLPTGFFRNPVGSQAGVTILC